MLQAAIEADHPRQYGGLHDIEGSEFNPCTLEFWGRNVRRGDFSRG